jgi:hypothetical protein
MWPPTWWHLRCHGPAAVPRCLRTGRGSFERANEALTAQLAVRPTATLVADLRRYATGRFKPPGFGSEAPLTDGLAHGADIRIPLGLSDARPPAR